MPGGPVSSTYRFVMLLATPIVRWWGRLRVHGLELLNTPEPLLLFANHDSRWDPLVAGVAARGVQIRALAKSSLWDNRVLAAILNGMGQIPVERGRGDLTALSAAIEQLQDGGCVGVFPEGTISRGQVMKPHSGAGRLAIAVPTARVLGLRITGAVGIARFPRRPRITVTFFEPSGGQAAEGESAIKLTRRVMADVRSEAPFVSAKRAKSAT